MPHLPGWLLFTISRTLIGYAGYLRLWHGRRLARSLADAVIGGCLSTLIAVMALPNLPRVWPTLTLGGKVQAVYLLLSLLVLIAWLWQDALFYQRRKRESRLSEPPT